MAFRRSFSKIEQSSIRRQAILLTAAVVVLFVLVNLGIDFMHKPAALHVISLEMQDSSTFIIDKDTTNFDNFASILKEKVIDARKNHAYNNIEIIVQIPKAKNTADVADVIKIVDAMDVPFSIQTEKQGPK